MSDTRQQRAILKQSASARKIRARFPEGTEIVAHVSGRRGVVQRHVPGTNAQGGTLSVKWEDGRRGQGISPSQVKRQDAS